MPKDKETIERVQQLINDDTNFIVLYYNREKVTPEELITFYKQLDSEIKPALGRPIQFICCDIGFKLESHTKEEIRKMLYDEDDFCGEGYGLHKGCTAAYCPKCGRKLKEEV